MKVSIHDESPCKVRFFNVGIRKIWKRSVLDGLISQVKQNKIHWLNIVL